MGGFKFKRLTALSAAIGSIVGLSHAQAGNTWNGGGTSGNWSDANNWGGSLPGYGTLTFSGGSYTTNTDDYLMSMNQINWNGSSTWTLNQGGSTVLSLYDNGGTQAKIENYSTGPVTINLPITFAANNGSPPNPFGEINAINGDITFGTGTLTVNGSSVYGIKLYGTGHTVTFNNTVSASGKYFATTTSNDTINIGGAFTSGDIYLMNNGTVNVTGTNTVTTSAVRLGGDFGTTGSQNLAQGATFELTQSTGGQNFGGIINSVSGNTGSLVVNSTNTSGTNTLSGGIYLDSNLTLQNSTNGNLAISGSTVDLKANQLTLNPSGSMSITPAIINSTGSGSIVKTGSGSVTFTGANTYTGGTNISGGTLIANTTGSGNSSTGTGTVTIGTSGTLAGSGNTGTGTVVVNGKITAGSGGTTSDTIGTLTTGTQNWNTSGTYIAKLASGGGSDHLIMSGLIAPTSANQFTIQVTGLSGATYSPGQTWILANAISASAGTFVASMFNLITSGSAPAASHFKLSEQADTNFGGGEDLVLTDTDSNGAPEPTSFLLLGTVACPLLLGRRRRRVCESFEE